MLSELIVLSLAAAIGWETLRYFSPWKISPRLSHVIVILISYLMTFCYSQSAVMALAATGGAAVFRYYVKADLAVPDQVRLRFPVLNLRGSPKIDYHYPGSRRIRGL